MSCSLPKPVSAGTRSYTGEEVADPDSQHRFDLTGWCDCSSKQLTEAEWDMLQMDRQPAMEDARTETVSGGRAQCNPPLLPQGCTRPLAIPNPGCGTPLRYL